MAVVDVSTLYYEWSSRPTYSPPPLIVEDCEAGWARRLVGGRVEDASYVLSSGHGSPHRGWSADVVAITRAGDRTTSGPPIETTEGGDRRQAQIKAEWVVLDVAKGIDSASCRHR